MSEKKVIQFVFLFMDPEKGFFFFFYYISEIIGKGLSFKIRSPRLDSESLKKYFTIYK